MLSAKEKCKIITINNVSLSSLIEIEKSQYL